MFESVMELTQEQVQWLDDCTNGTWSINPQTGLVDVKGGFDCSQQSLTDFKGVRFGVVDGDFYCADNQLTSLEGAPHKVDGYFVCYNNPVTGITLKTIFDKMQQVTSYLAAVESLWSEIPQEDQVLLYADDFKWVSPEQSKGLLALRAYQDLRGML